MVGRLGLADTWQGRVDHSYLIILVLMLLVFFLVLYFT